jgi:hypothetical protein
MSEWGTSHLALLYLKEHDGHPTQYRQELMDGVTQGFAFLHSMSHKERANLPWILFQQLKITNTVAKLEEIILQLLDYNAKKGRTNVS